MPYVAGGEERLEDLGRRGRGDSRPGVLDRNAERAGLAYRGESDGAGSLDCLCGIAQEIHEQLHERARVAGEQAVRTVPSDDLDPGIELIPQERHGRVE